MSVLIPQKTPANASSAGTGRYRKIKEGDVLVFVCGKDRIQKEVAKARWFKTIDDTWHCDL